MKKHLLLLVILLTFTNFSSIGQNPVVRITQTQILLPDTITLDTLTKGNRTVLKVIIRNDRNNSVYIKNIKTPPGAGAMLNDTILKPRTQTVLYIGFDTNFMDIKGNFNSKITLETNLIKNIEINVKGYIKTP